MTLISLQIVQHLQLGGIEKLVLDILKFKASNHRIFILALEGDKQTTLENWPELIRYQDCLLFLNKPPRFDYDSIKKLRHLIQEHQIQAIYTHHIGPLIYGGLAILGLNCKHIHIEHDAWHLQQTKSRWLTNLALRKKTVLVADAHIVAQQLSHYLHHPINHIITNGIDTKAFITGDKKHARDILNLSNSDILIGCAGRLVKEKGIADVIHALAFLPSKIHLAIAGDGPEKASLQQLTKIRNIEHRVHWLGRHENMPIFYQALDVYLLASHKEGLPLAILEAQATECTIIATKVGAIEEVLLPTQGYLIPANNINVLVNIIKKALTHPKPPPLTTEEKQHIDIRNTVHRYEALL